MASIIHDGRGAMKAIADGDPDLIVLDYNLPGETGLEILRQVRRRRGADIMPSLMLTARGGRLLKVRAEETGIDDYMVKPFVPDALVRRVEALLVGRDILLATRQLVTAEYLRGAEVVAAD